MPTLNRPKDYAPAAHLLHVLRLLEEAPGHALFVNTLAEDLGVHRRTILRYVDALASMEDGAGRPLVTRSSDRAGASVALTSPPISVAANLYQYAAMALATRVLGPGRSILGESADAMMTRLSVSLGAVGADELTRRVKQAVFYAPFGPKEYGGQEGVLDAVLRSTLRRQVLDLVYQGPSSKGGGARRIEPFTLVLYRDGLYVLARDPAAPDKALRLYAVDRIARAEVGDETFEVPRTFSPRGELGERFGLWSAGAPKQAVVLRIFGHAADVALERAWPGLLGIDEGEGYADVTLEVEITPEVRTWILGFGDTIEVLAPASLRSEIAAVFTRAAARNGAAP